jgi:spore maturation protein SpmB
LITELATLKSDSVPDRFKVWGLPGALSLIVRAPLWVPGAVGVKVTLMMQPEPDGITGWQLFVSVNSPVTLTPLILNGTAPVLDSITL